MNSNRFVFRAASIAFIGQLVLSTTAALVHAGPDADQIRFWSERGKANGLLMEQKIDEALEILLRHKREAKTPYQQGEAEFQIGYAYFYMGDDRQATRYYRAGVEKMTEQGYLSESTGFADSYPFILGDADRRHKLAYACFRMGKLKAAAGILTKKRQELDRFLETSKNSSARSTALVSTVRVLNTLGLVQKQSGDEKAAAETFARMVKVCGLAMREQQASPFNGPGSTILLHFRHSQALHEVGQHEPALQAVDKCLAEVRQAWGDKAGKTTAESYYHEHRTKVLEALGRPEQAINSAEKALEVAEADAMSNWAQPEAAFRLGELNRKLQRWDQAEAAYKRAIAKIEGIYSNVNRSTARDGFLESKIAVYPRLAQLLAERGRWQESFTMAEAGRSRRLLDMLGNAPVRETGAARLDPELLKQDRAFAAKLRGMTQQLQTARWNRQIDARAVREQHRQTLADYDRFRDTLALRHPGYAVFQTIQTADENDLRKIFHGNPDLAETALISYLISDDTLVGYCFDGEKLDAKILSKDSAKLIDTVRDLRAAIAARSPDWQAGARQLDELLIEPFAEELAGKTRLFVVPHQQLHFLPFAVLRDAAQKTLIERFEICTIPSASILRLWSQPSAGNDSLSASGRRALVIANPDGSLPFAQQEVESVKRAFADADALIGDAAQEDAFFRLVPQADIIHVATHGVSNPVRPEYSNLLLARPAGGSSVADGLLDVHEIVRKLDARRAKLVVLSACETAMGQASRGDEVQSLATAFLCAGAREVIASLWSVDDRATARLMDDFYAALSAGKPPARALRESMIRRAGTGKHPYYWAAFQLIGNR